MAIPKSTKLVIEEDMKRDNAFAITASNIKAADNSTGPVKIREIKCLNDFVAILLFRVKSDILMPEQQQYRNEGMVVGIGEGIPDNLGGRVKSQLSLGDVVLFQERNIVADVSSDSEPYKDQKVVIVSERSLICKLPAVPFQLVK